MSYIKVHSYSRKLYYVYFISFTYLQIIYMCNIYTHIHIPEGTMNWFTSVCVYTHTHTHTHIYIYIYIYSMSSLSDHSKLIPQLLLIQSYLKQGCLNEAHYWNIKDGLVEMASYEVRSEKIFLWNDMCIPCWQMYLGYPSDNCNLSIFPLKSFIHNVKSPWERI